MGVVSTAEKIRHGELTESRRLRAVRIRDSRGSRRESDSRPFTKGALMEDSIDLHYDLGSTVGPLDYSVVKGFESWLHQSECERIHFENTYINHLRMAHGGVPGKRYFRTVLGTPHVVERFLNFVDSGCENAIRQYSVPCVWSDIEDRLGPMLMPFAELFAGDYLCFDYRLDGRPQIVVWSHELSNDDLPHTELVADNFDAFLQKLTIKPFDCRS